MLPLYAKVVQSSVERNPTCSVRVHNTKAEVPFTKSILVF